MSALPDRSNQDSRPVPAAGCHLCLTGSTKASSVPAGYSSIGGDCNDADMSMFPRGLEICDAKDNGCNGAVDDGNILTMCGPTPNAVAACTNGLCVMAGV